MFNFIKEKIKKVYTTFTAKAASLFSKNKIDEEFLKELEVLLISADTGVATTKKIISKLRDDTKNQKITTGEELKAELEKQLLEVLKNHTKKDELAPIIMLVGVNGSGKTTFAAKLAKNLQVSGKKVLLVAADTFRAAAVQQLEEWGKRINVEIFKGKENQDPASIVFDACSKFEEQKFDHIIIDTAGRLQTKVNLMKELEKIRKIIDKKLPTIKVNTWLTIDSMLGQNSFQQAKIFHEATNINGLILTKLDGTGKGGIVFSISAEFNLPIIYTTFGEKLEDIEPFSPENYVKNLLEQ